MKKAKSLYEQVKQKFTDSKGAPDFKYINSNGITFNVTGESRKRFTKETKVRATVMVGLGSHDAMTVKVNITPNGLTENIGFVKLFDLMLEYSYVVYHRGLYFDGKTVWKSVPYGATPEVFDLGRTLNLHEMYHFGHDDLKVMKDKKNEKELHEDFLAD